MTDIGSLGGTTVATGINASGQITGESFLTSQVQVPCTDRRHKGPASHIPATRFCGATGQCTTSARSAGSTQGHSDQRPARWPAPAAAPPARPRSRAGSPIRAGYDRDRRRPAAINDSGVIAGAGPFPVAGTPGDVFEQAFTFRKGPRLCSGCSRGPAGSSPPRPRSTAPGRCGRGDNSQSYERAWKYQNGVMTDLGTLGGPQASATAINGSGQIVGFAQTSSDADHGFLDTGGKMKDLGLNVFPDAINDTGAVVAEGPGGALIDSGGTIRNLTNLAPAGFTLSSAVGINDNGQIVANGSNASGQSHSFLLTPN